jgi:retron-type reverse transcriptase
MISKAGGKLRRRETATITDRVVQASLKLVLEPVSDLRKVRYARF